MQCNDCPNQTDSKCCHQLIRPQGSKTMNISDERAWEREFEHAQTVQEWHKDRERRHKLKLLECAITQFNDEIKDHDHEINDQ